MRVRWVLAIGLAAAMLTGCGEGSETADPPVREKPEELAVALEGWKGPEIAGFLMAERRGYFADAGLVAKSRSPSSPTLAILDVVNGTDDLGISHMPQVVLARERGAPVVAIASLVPQPTADLIWLSDSRIGSVADLRGKTVAIPGLRFQRAFLERILAPEGMTLDDVRLQSVGNDLVPALASGRADAIFGGSRNVAGVELETRGLEPVATSVAKAGIPAYDEFVLVARSDRLSEEPGVFRDFLSALADGTDAALADPAGTVDSLAGTVEANPETTFEGTRSQVEATLPLLSEDGYMDPEQASGLVSWMHAQGLIEREPSAAELLTNAYLP